LPLITQINSQNAPGTNLFFTQLLANYRPPAS
jgi:hypothetical protein